MMSILWNFGNLFYGPAYGVSWEMFHVRLRMCVLLLLGGVFYRCLSGPVGFHCYVSLLVCCWSSIQLFWQVLSAVYWNLQWFLQKRVFFLLFFLLLYFGVMFLITYISVLKKVHAIIELKVKYILMQKYFRVYSYEVLRKFMAVCIMKKLWIGFFSAPKYTF